MVNPQQSLGSLAHWSQTLGLLPVRLFNDHANGQPVVLLNGADGNFVLDVAGAGVNEDTRDHAWSANVSHYVSVRRNAVEVQRWDQSRSVRETYSSASVLANLEGFHTYLERHTPRPDLSIVSHGIHVFRALRGILRDEVNGSDSLQGFLFLLACSTESTERSQVSLERWGLLPTAKVIANSLSSSEWDLLTAEIQRGRPLEELKPHLNLLLRHAAGQLFQEAHYEVVYRPQLQMMLEGFLPEPFEVQKAPRGLGLHFTPPALVRTLVEEAIDLLGDEQQDLIVFDPACGSGEFLREALRQLKMRSDPRPVRIIGWDISPAACAMASFALAWEKRDMPNVEVSIQCVDSLSSDTTWPQQITMILMNPPFVSWNDMGRDQREQVRNILGPNSGRIPDLSHAFLYKAVESLRADGILSTVLPGSFLSAQSAQRIREAFSEQLEPQLIARLGNQLLFPGVLVDAGCYVAIKRKPTRRNTVAFWADSGKSSTAAGMRMLRKLRRFRDTTITNAASLYPVVRDNFSIYLYPAPGPNSPTWAPPPYNSWRLFRNVDRLLTVADLFVVNQGAITGANSMFLLSADQWASLPKSERRFFRPAVTNDSIREGSLHASTYVFYPYGKLAIKDEEELARLVPGYYRQYLLPERNQRVARPRFKVHEWWKLNWPRLWQEEHRVKIVTKFFGEEGSFALDSTGEYVVVQGNAWQFKKEQEERLPLGSVHNFYRAYLALLNSSLFTELLAAVSNQVAGGQWDLSKRYVELIPIPNLLDQEVSSALIQELLELEELNRQGEKTDDRIRELLSPLYSSNI